ncbi:YbgA family protein [Marinicella litoralis]|uniref:Uncharacterized protein YbgA (DUF1722 family) n=1 Tax=Marinicella litoralis TaxID=644220 RepID=A0A4R6XS00_9GAMM|nr:DUF523 and DUF1722 domain-containing protein [Marinicella litoralis]TDR22695.1 uncharacterized protein YbgA (DUF1722 family) [Marinicella litoralis]
MKKIKVGISACLLGQAVRFNGSHKNSVFCNEILSEWFEYVPICPEVEIGMGVPREPIRLVNENNQIRVKNVTDQSKDYTDQLHALADQRAPELHDLCGYIFMQKSPSCGVFRVKVYNQNGMPETNPAMGAFAYQLKQHYPLLPMEEAGRINDIRLRENFIIRVFANQDWREHVLAAPLAKNLVAFHTRYKFLLQAHSESHYRKLGQLVADAGVKPIDEILQQYFTLFTECLTQVAKINNHVNVLLHMMGFLKNQLPSEVKASLLNLIERYKEQKVHLIVPITMLKHYVDIHQIEYLMNQKYLSPYPYELGLRNSL